MQAEENNVESLIKNSISLTQELQINKGCGCNKKDIEEIILKLKDEIVKDVLKSLESGKSSKFKYEIIKYVYNL